MRKSGVFVVIALAAVLTGCAGVLPFIPGEPRAEAVPVDELRCGDGMGISDPEVIAGGLPADFEPVAFIRCDGFGSLTDDEGVWGGTRAEHFEGDLTDLLAALAEPDEAPSLGPCTADMWIGPELWLAGADGRYIRAPYPATGCGKPRPEVLERIDAAIAVLTPTQVDFERRTLIESSAATRAGCPTSVGMLVIADAPEIGAAPTPEPGASLGVAVIPWEPPRLPDSDTVVGARLCWYESGVPSSNGAPMSMRDNGTFVGVGELDVDRARQALVLIPAATRAGVCDETATSFALLQTLPEADAGAAASVTVELDGCRRLVGADLMAYDAPDELLALLAP